MPPEPPRPRGPNRATKRPNQKPMTDQPHLRVRFRNTAVNDYPIQFVSWIRKRDCFAYLHDLSSLLIRRFVLQTAIRNCNWNLVPPVPLFARWQDMSLSKSPSDLGAVSRFAPHMPLLNPISTEPSLYLS